MVLTLIGFSLNFIGTFAIIIEAIFGDSIRPKIYWTVLKVVCISRRQWYKKNKTHEIRVLLWV